MCRTALITLPDEEDEDDEEGSDEDDSDEESEAGTDAEESTEPRMNIANLTKRLVTMGYTMEDMVMAHLGGSFCQIIKGLERHNDEFFEKYEQILDDIVDGKIAADFRDERTFAQVVAGTRIQ
jgi:hypothetical protein